MVTYQQEFLDTFWKDSEELLELHWEELANNRDKIKLNPDKERYYVMEDLGKLKVFTVRDSGDLVGYFLVVVDTGLHYKDHLFATNDVIFLHKSHRGSSVGKKLIEFAQDCLEEDGVSVLTINTKVHQPFDGLMEHMGFNLSERVYSKYIGE